MEKYSKAVSEMYSQFNQREGHPLGKYIGRLISFSGERVEVVGYSRNKLADEHGNVQAAYIRGRQGAMKLVSMGAGLENVSSKIWEEKVWKH